MSLHISLVGRKNFSTEIYRQTHDAILNGLLSPGDPLPANWAGAVIVEAMNRGRSVQVDFTIPVTVASRVQVLPRAWEKPCVVSVHSIFPSNSVAMRIRPSRSGVVVMLTTR